MPTFLIPPINQLILAVVLGIAGVYLLLPKPKGRSVAVGTFLAIAAMGVFGMFLVTNLGQPTTNTISSALFWVFSAGAVGFGVMMISQRNPGRGAIAFAFVILSTCGLFLLLAAPFLMAATIIIYAGAIIVTFLFLLMLSHVSGPSDENDRTREPLMGSLAGFAFIGLLLFSLQQANPANAAGLPVEPLTSNERATLKQVVDILDNALKTDDPIVFGDHVKSGHDLLADCLGNEVQPTAPKTPTILSRHAIQLRDKPTPRGDIADDPRQNAFLKQLYQLKKTNDEFEEAAVMGTDMAKGKAAAGKLKDEVTLFAGHGQLPARNVANIGFVLYSEYILAVEMAGTLLLVATIGAVAIAGKRKEVKA